MRRTLTNNVEIKRTISIITLNVNGLNIQDKHRDLSEWMKNKPDYILSTRNPL